MRGALRETVSWPVVQLLSHWACADLVAKATEKLCVTELEGK